MNFYFRPKKFESKNNWKIYEKLWVKYTQAIVMWTVWKVFRLLKMDSIAGNYFIWERNERNLRIYIWWTKFNETIHWWFVPLTLYAFIDSLTLWNNWITLLHFLHLSLQFQLTILQRYNRTRAARVLEKRYSKKDIRPEELEKFLEQLDQNKLSESKPIVKKVDTASNTQHLSSEQRPHSPES